MSKKYNEYRGGNKTAHVLLQKKRLRNTFAQVGRPSGRFLLKLRALGIKDYPKRLKMRIQKVSRIFEFRIFAQDRSAAPPQACHYMKLGRRCCLIAITCILVACGGRDQFVPTGSKAAVVGYPKKSHFQLFSFGLRAAVAMAAGRDGDLWFSACHEAGKGPCKIGFFDRALHVTWVPGKFPFVQDLAVGPDGNMWFDEGFFYPIPHNLGKITRSLKVHLYPIRGWAKGIVGGPDGRMWFDYSGGLASISTDGQALRTTKYRVADWNRAGVVMFFGADRRLYFQRSTDTDGYPVCALAVFWKKLQCYRDPKSTAGAIPLMFAGRLILTQNAYTNRVYGLAMSGPRIDIKGGHAFYPLVFTKNGKLIAESLDPNNPNTGVTVTELSDDAFLRGTYYSLTYRQTQSQSYDYDRGVTTSDGYVWLHSGLGGSLTRFSIRE